MRLGAAIAALVLGSSCGGSPDAPTGQSAIGTQTALPAEGPDQAAQAAGGRPADAAPAVTPPPGAGTPPAAGKARAPAPPTTTRGAASAMPAPPAAVVAPQPPGVTTASAVGTVVTLRITPPEQYRGGVFHTAVQISGPTAIRSVTLDLGNGTLVQADPAPTWACPNGSREVLAGPPAYAYPAPGRYTVTALVTVVPCVFMPGPSGVAMPWVASGPEKVVQAKIDVTQRAEPPPVG